jgi:hypothetical protein
MNTLRRLAPDAAIIAAITLSIGLIAQQWAGLDTPDSSFYFTLANFGSEVTDRAPVDSYYWTRLGVIAPTYAFTQVLGPWVAYFLWRMALLALIITAFYVTSRKFNASRAQAALVAGTLSASTVLVSYLGNPYVTATSLAALAALTCASLFATTRAVITSGALLGWLAMINPYAALLGGSIWVAVTLQRTIAAKEIKTLVKSFVAAAVTAAVVFGVFLLVGTQLFPGMNWFTTYIEWNAKLDYADFASTTPIWLNDFTLLIPLYMLLVIAINWWRDKNPRTQTALTIGLTTLGFTFAFLPAMAGITLEATIYTVMLWIPMSIALILSTSTRIASNIWISVTGIALVITAGFIAPNFSGVTAFALILVATATLIYVSPKKLAAVALIAFLVCAQLIQNSREQIGLYYSSPFAWAYQENPIQLKLANSLKAQQWLINNTTPQDRILTYVDGDWLAGDRDLYVAAGMQFWGENRISVTKELRPEDQQRLQDLKPTTFALYGPSKEALQQYANQLQSQFANTTQLSPLQCLDFDWPTLTNGAMICLSTVSTGE